MYTGKQAIYLTLFSILISQAACSTTQRTPSPKAQYKSIYIDQLKLTYLRQLLKKSYNNSAAVNDIIENDHSGFTEPVLTEEDYKLIDSLTTIDNQRLIADSVAGSGRAEGGQGKRPLSYITDKLSGKWLDSLAKRRLKLNGVTDGWEG